MEKIVRVSVTDSVVESIKNLIASGKCGIGEKLPTEAALCEALGVSRTSIREGIRVLQAQGFVEIRPGKGAFVIDYKEPQRPAWYLVANANFNDYLEVRTAIETLSVRLAAERASEEEINELRTIQKSFVEAHYMQEVSRLVILDENFHIAIAKCTKNKFLINIQEELTENFRPYRITTFASPNNYANAISVHENIINSIVARDAEKAAELMHLHINITENDYHRAIRESKGS